MKDIFEKVTKQLVEQLEQIERGEIEARWFRPWTSSGMPQFPTNQTTGMDYKGINALLLHMMALGHGYRTNRWMTFKQKNSFNSEHDSEMVIRKGEHGYPIYKFVEWVPKQFKKRNGGCEGYVDTKNGGVYTHEQVRKLALRQYTVFNIDQMDNVPKEHQPYEDEPNWEARYEGAHQFLTKLDCPVVHGEIDKAFYSSQHKIHMPMMHTFQDEAHYLATLFHEHVHSTGKALDRDMSGQMGDDSYAREELVAEIGSALLCAQYGIEAPVQHPEYIRSYIKQLSEKDRAFWNAANQAQKAVDHLVNQCTSHN